eukprot:Tamp_27715.p1 GENE.Tamp_27715~~Tamp_27715.p1  ORF type:complete len:235 (+),score=35.81 Tamp_27715:19-723(+)
MRIPRAEGFLYCITLRFGVYSVCLYDVVSGVFDVVGSIATLVYPEIMLRSQDNDAYHDIETDATSGAGRRMMARASRATIMLAALAIYFGFRGAIAARVGNPKDMGEYVGYKALFLALTLVMQLSLHRLWWDGCGVLTQEVCTDQKFQFIFIALVAVLPGLYCLWVSWSLFDALKDNTEHVLYRAGYDQVCTPHASALCALVSFAFCAHTWCQRTCGPLHVHTHRLPAHASRCA